MRVDPQAREDSLGDISVMAEQSSERAAQKKTRVQISGDGSTNLVEFRSQSKYSDAPNLSVVVPADKQVAIRLTPDSYRVHVTPVDPSVPAQESRNPRSITFVEVTGTPIILDISRLATNRLPFPRAGAGS